MIAQRLLDAGRALSAALADSRWPAPVGLAIARVNALGADGTVVGTATAGTQTHGFLLVPQSARR